MDWKFLIGDVGIPIGIFLFGLVVGRNWDNYSKKIAKSKIKGNKNIVTQNSK